MIKLQDVTKCYPPRHLNQPVLDGINLQVKEGEFCALTGPSGSGKSTLLRIIGLMDSGDFGSYYFDGTPVHKLSDGKLCDWRRNKVGFLFQNYNLIASLAVADNILLPMRFAGKTNFDRVYFNQLVKELGIEDQLKKRPDKLSGGQQQRVALARALIMKPKVLVADEATANLDKATAETVLNFLNHLKKVANLTIIFATHNHDVVAHADREINIKKGIIV